MITSQEEFNDKYQTPEKSDINIEKGISGDLGISGYAIDKLYADFIFAEFIDVNDGYVTNANGLVTVENSKKAWRRAIVRKVSTVIEKHGTTKTGDIVIFPSDKGLVSGKHSYIDADGNIKTTEHGLFLNEYRIFATIKKA